MEAILRIVVKTVNLLVIILHIVNGLLAAAFRFKLPKIDENGLVIPGQNPSDFVAGGIWPSFPDFCREWFYGWSRIAWDYAAYVFAGVMLLNISLRVINKKFVDINEAIKVWATWTPTVITIAMGILVFSYDIAQVEKQQAIEAWQAHTERVAPPTGEDRIKKTIDTGFDKADEVKDSVWENGVWISVEDTEISKDIAEQTGGSTIKNVGFWGIGKWLMPLLFLIVWGGLNSITKTKFGPGDLLSFVWNKGFKSKVLWPYFWFCLPVFGLAWWYHEDQKTNPPLFFLKWELTVQHFIVFAMAFTTLVAIIHILIVQKRKGKGEGEASAAESKESE